MSLRVLIVLVALLVVLFCVGTGLGACGDDSGGAKASWPDRLGELFVTEQALTASEISAGGCLKSGVFEVMPGSGCTATIASSDSYVRKAKLRLISGGEVQIELTPNGDGAFIKRGLKVGDDPMELQVFRDGARLALRFRDGAGADRCRVKLE